jgi:hypothetical protein
LKVAYVDTSCLVAVALDEPGARGMAAKLRKVDRLFSANLLEAEFRSAMQREDVTAGVDQYLSAISWILPERALTAEIRVVLEHGYIRGADLWHLSCALYLCGDPTMLPFLTLDDRQRAVAAALGFPAG